MMNPFQLSMSKFPSLCEQYFFLVDTESASHFGMLVDFDIGGSLMNTSERTDSLLFFCISLAMCLYLGQV